MRWRRGTRLGGAMWVVVVVAAVGAVSVGVVVVVARGAPSHGSAAELVAGPEGFALRPPDGWVVRGAGDGTVLEVAQRPALGLVPVRGLWVSRWAPGPEGRTRIAATTVAGSRLGGEPAARTVQARRLPLHLAVPGVDLAGVRVRYLTLHGPLAYELVFWGPQSDVGGALERRVVDSFRFFPPTARHLEGKGFAMSVPGSWERPPPGDGDRSLARAFAPNDPVPAEWVYVFERRGTDLEAALASLLADLDRDRGRRTAPVRALGPTSIGGRPAVHLSFEREELGRSAATPAISSIDEYLIDAGRGRFLLLALGHRGPSDAQPAIVAGFRVR